jgi:nucleotide-binding universal stress UspA family protein
MASTPEDHGNGVNGAAKCEAKCAHKVLLRPQRASFQAKVLSIHFPSGMVRQTFWQNCHKNKEDSMATIKTILCAVDLSEISAQVADYAKTFAKSFGAKVKVIYVAPSLTQYVGFHVPPSSIESFVGEIVSGAEKTMDAFIQEHFADVEVEGYVANGYAAEEIIRYADEQQVDLIIMGTHGRRGIDRVLFGSVAEKIVKAATMPVLTLRPK